MFYIHIKIFAKLFPFDIQQAAIPREIIFFIIPDQLQSGTGFRELFVRSPADQIRNPSQYP